MDFFKSKINARLVFTSVIIATLIIISALVIIPIFEKVTYEYRDIDFQNADTHQMPKTKFTCVTRLTTNPAFIPQEDISVKMTLIFVDSMLADRIKETPILVLFH